MSDKTKMQIEYWDIDRLIPYARNPRKNDDAVPKMAGVIKEFGFKVPIVAKSDGEVIDGHLRLKAAQKLGMKEVPVVLADEWTPAQVKAFRLAVNRSAEWAEWDDELLKLELDDLKLEDFDLDLIGFEDFQLEDGPVDGLTDPDEVPEVQEKAVTQTGDIWILGRHRLMCGDSTDAGSVALLMENGKADLVLTDPPYGIGGTKSDKNNYDIYEDSEENLEKLIAGFIPIAQDVASRVVLTPGNKQHRKYPVPDWEMAWFCPAGVSCGPWGFTCWQPILCYGKDPKLAKGKGRFPDAIVFQEGTDIKWHPCAKPVQFWGKLLERCSEPKDIVFDPFSGSGTTLICCEKSDRVCRALELSPNYVDCTIRRWQDFTGKEATLEASGKIFAQVAQERGA